MKEEKIENQIPELSDELLDRAAGGIGPADYYEYDCQGGCGGHYYGRPRYRVGNQPYCVNCYNEYLKNQQTGNRR